LRTPHDDGGRSHLQSGIIRRRQIVVAARDREQAWVIRDVAKKAIATISANVRQSADRM
jgi:hypothetical protein